MSEEESSFKLKCRDGSLLIDRLDALHWGRLAEAQRSTKADPLALSIVGSGKPLELLQYSRWVTSMFFAVTMLERQMKQHKQNKLLRPLFVSEAIMLGRSGHLQEDLAFFLGDEFVKHIKMTPAASRYINMIQLACHSKPELLLAHAYVVYIGLLAVGRSARQVIATMVDRFDGKGSRLFDFDIEDLPGFANRWMHQVDSCDISVDDADALVREASNAFSCMRSILEESLLPPSKTVTRRDEPGDGDHLREAASGLDEGKALTPIPGHKGIDFANATASDCPFLNPKKEDFDRPMTASEKLIAVCIWFFILSGTAVFLIEGFRSITADSTSEGGSIPDSDTILPHSL